MIGAESEGLAGPEHDGRKCRVPALQACQGRVAKDARPEVQAHGAYASPCGPYTARQLSRPPTPSRPPAVTVTTPSTNTASDSLSR